MRRDPSRAYTRTPPALVPTTTHRSWTWGGARGRQGGPGPGPGPGPRAGDRERIQQSAVTRSPGGAASEISATHRRCGDASSSEAACGTVAAIARRRPRATARWVAPGASAMVTLERAARSEPEGPSRISAGAGGPRPTPPIVPALQHRVGDPGVGEEERHERVARRHAETRRQPRRDRRGRPGDARHRSRAGRLCRFGTRRIEFLLTTSSSRSRDGTQRLARHARRVACARASPRGGELRRRRKRPRGAPRAIRELGARLGDPVVVDVRRADASGGGDDDAWTWTFLATVAPASVQQGTLASDAPSASDDAAVLDPSVRLPSFPGAPPPSARVDAGDAPLEARVRALDARPAPCVTLRVRARDRDPTPVAAESLRRLLQHASSPPAPPSSSRGTIHPRLRRPEIRTPTRPPNQTTSPRRSSFTAWTRRTRRAFASHRHARRPRRRRRPSTGRPPPRSRRVLGERGSLRRRG